MIRVVSSAFSIKISVVSVGTDATVSLNVASKLL
jgi:hypothetical protein